MNSVQSATVCVLGAVLLATACFAMRQCTVRNWEFEDACRRAGGVVMDASKVSASSGGSSRDICAEVVQAPVAKPIALPNYRK